MREMESPIAGAEHPMKLKSDKDTRHVYPCQAMAHLGSVDPERKMAAHGENMNDFKTTVMNLHEGGKRDI